MKTLELFNSAFSDVNDKFIDEAISYEKNTNEKLKTATRKFSFGFSKKIFAFYSSVATIIIVLVLVFSSSMSSKPPVITDITNQKLNQIEVNGEFYQTANRTDEIQRVYPFYELPYCKSFNIKYNEIDFHNYYNFDDVPFVVLTTLPGGTSIYEFNCSKAEIYNQKYDSCFPQVDESLVGEKLSDVSLSYENLIDDYIYYKNAEIYALNGFSSNFAILVKFENSNRYYPYVGDYNFSSVEEILSVSKFEENVNYGEITYSSVILNHLNSFTFFEPDKTKLKELFFDGTENVQQPEIFELSSKYFNIKLTIPVLGVEGAYFSLNDKGVLFINLNFAQKSYYIGEEKYQQFVDYVLTLNCKRLVDPNPYTTTQSTSTSQKVSTSQGNSGSNSKTYQIPAQSTSIIYTKRASN